VPIWRFTFMARHSFCLAMTLLLPDTANAQKQPVASEVPQPTPTLTGAIPPMAGNLQPSQATASGSPTSLDQRLAQAQALQAPGVVPDIRPAPPVPSGIRQAPPPVQVAQAPQSFPGYVTPKPGDPVAPPQVRRARSSSTSGSPPIRAIRTRQRRSRRSWDNFRPRGS
jgi:hypothetical protein